MGVREKDSQGARVDVLVHPVLFARQNIEEVFYRLSVVVDLFSQLLCCPLPTRRSSWDRQYTCHEEAQGNIEGREKTGQLDRS
jgi:hypothetical protein